MVEKPSTGRRVALAHERKDGHEGKMNREKDKGLTRGEERYSTVLAGLEMGWLGGQFARMEGVLGGKSWRTPNNQQKKTWRGQKGMTETGFEVDHETRRVGERFWLVYPEKELSETDYPEEGKGLQATGRAWERRIFRGKKRSRAVP